MKTEVTIYFYLYFWLKITILSLATGLVVGFVALLPIIGPYGWFIGLVAGILGGQITVANHMLGSKRGRFEFDFREYSAKKNIKRALVNIMGWLSCQRLYLSEFGEISWSQGEYYDAILNNNEIEDETKYFVFIRAAKVALKNRNYENSIDYLKQAIILRPSALIPNFMLGESLERLGKGEEAITAYRTALESSSVKSDVLKNYISTQIDRIKKRGPAKKPPTPGLRHLGMGR